MAYWRCSRAQTDCVEDYRKQLEQHRNSSGAHFWIGVDFIEQKIWQKAANELREALSGGLRPACMEVWAHIYLGEVLDITGQHDRAHNEYRLAKGTKAGQASDIPLPELCSFALSVNSIRSVTVDLTSGLSIAGRLRLEILPETAITMATILPEF